MYTLRPATEADYPYIVDLINQIAPAPTTLEAYTAAQRRHPTDLPYLLLVALGPEGRFAGYGAGGHDLDQRPDSFFGLIRVVPAERGRGLGAQVLGYLADWVLHKGGRRLEATLREGTQDAAIAWAQRRGFAVESRVQRSELNLASDWDPSPYQAFMASFAGSGLRLVTLAEVGVTEESLRRFHAACQEWERHVPGRGPLTPDWVTWRRQIDGDPSWDPALVLLALDGERWAGLTYTDRQPDGSWYTHLTAMDPAYRGRGLGKALKTEVVLQARQQGVPMLSTFNHLNNGPMVAINDWLGYRPVFCLSQLTMSLDGSSLLVTS